MFEREKLIILNIITIADRANEIIRRQELAEERKARLAELGSVAKKKKGKKGKKKGAGKKKGETTVKKKSICWSCDFGSKLLVPSHRQLIIFPSCITRIHVFETSIIYFFIYNWPLPLIFWINYFKKVTFYAHYNWLQKPCNIYLLILI